MRQKVVRTSCGSHGCVLVLCQHHLRSTLFKVGVIVRRIVKKISFGDSRRAYFARFQTALMASLSAGRPSPITREEYLRCLRTLVLSFHSDRSSHAIRCGVGVTSLLGQGDDLTPTDVDCWSLFFRHIYTFARH